MSISDKIGILHNKTLIQFGTPQELFRNPANLYIAQFLGDVNILPNSIATQLGIEVQHDETAIVRVKESVIGYEKKHLLNCLLSKCLIVGIIMNSLYVLKNKKRFL